jgi:predicted aspartyl protease
MNYDDTFNVPAPALQVRVRARSRSRRAISVRARLDTGADITLIPATIVSALALRVEKIVIVAGYDGIAAERSAFLVTLEILGQKFSGVRVIASDRPEILLGLDILNRFVITLDGPAQRLKMLFP